MSLKSKIEAVIYASEEPVTLQQLAGLLGGEAEAELEALAALQAELPLIGEQLLSLDDRDDPRPSSSPEHMAPVQELPTGSDGTSATQQPSAPPVEEAVTPLDVEGAAPTDPSPELAADRRLQRDRDRAVREHLQRAAESLMRDYAESDRGIEIREVAGGYRMGTKPEYHDVVRGFARSLKPALKLTLQALETLAVVAYKQPVTAAEIGEIRGVDSAGVLGGLMARKLISTAGRKQVIGRPMLYRTTKDFLLRFGLKDIQELPSMEEFEKMASEFNEQEDLPIGDTGELIEEANARGDAEHLRDAAAEAHPSTPAEPELTDSQPSEPAT